MTCTGLSEFRTYSESGVDLGCHNQPPVDEIDGEEDLGDRTSIDFAV